MEGNENYDFSDLDDQVAAQCGKIGAEVQAMVDSWQWNREAEVASFPPEVQKYLLKDWQPGQL